MLNPWKKSYDQPGQHIKKQRHYFANKGPSSQSYAFSNRKEMRKSKMAVWGGLTKAVERREAKSKGEKERYKHLNAEFQE